MFKKFILKRFVYFCFVSCFLILFFIFLLNFLILKNSHGRIFFVDNENLENKQAALVLGARVWENGKMSDIFRDRVKVGLALYENEKVDKILVSGDHGRIDYDEVNAAKDFLLDAGVPDEDIFLDHAGFDTYDSLYRAKHIFQVKSLLIVTQNFHLPRAIFIGDSLDMDVFGVNADLQKYKGEKHRNFREKLACIKAFFNVVFKSKPKFMGEVLVIDGDGRSTWD